MAKFTNTPSLSECPRRPEGYPAFHLQWVKMGGANEACDNEDKFEPVAKPSMSTSSPHGLTDLPILQVYLYILTLAYLARASTM